MIVTSSSTVAGHRIVKTLGLVTGNTVRARHMGKDILAVLKNVVGGEIEEYTKLLAESRQQSLDRMAAQAKVLGANAVVDARFGTSYIMGAAAEILAYGTAVLLEEQKPHGGP
ncbi:MAG TPA: YbjQ family protein [Clostridia bacterium]|nr:YbjQ family protein [Clostridia bacterium]